MEQGLGILGAEGGTKQSNFYHRTWLSQHGSPWSELQTSRSRRSGSTPTALSAEAICWQGHYVAYLIHTLYGISAAPHTILGISVGTASPTTISNCCPSSMLHSFCWYLQLLASFPGPAQLFVACSTEEPGIFPHVSIICN